MTSEFQRALRCRDALRVGFVGSSSQLAIGYDSDVVGAPYTFARLPASHPMRTHPMDVDSIENETRPDLTDADVEATLRDVLAFLNDPAALLRRARYLVQAGCLGEPYKTEHLDMTDYPQ